MPLTAKGNDILASMKKEYGEKKGEEVFYASKNAGKISGVDSDEERADDEKYKGYKIIPGGAGDEWAVFKDGIAIKTKFKSVAEAKKWVDSRGDSTSELPTDVNPINLGAEERADAESFEVEMRASDGLKETITVRASSKEQAKRIAKEDAVRKHRNREYRESDWKVLRVNGDYSAGDSTSDIPADVNPINLGADCDGVMAKLDSMAEQIGSLGKRASNILKRVDAERYHGLKVITKRQMEEMINNGWQVDYEPNREGRVEMRNEKGRREQFYVKELMR